MARSSTARRAGRLMGRVLAVVLAIVAFGFLATAAIYPKVTGGAALTVLSGSMRPTYPVGSLLLVDPVQPEEVAVGDVITFAQAGTSAFTTHRVIEIDRVDSGLEFTTQGDANEAPDPYPVAEGALRGRVAFSVPHLGALRQRITSPAGLVALTGLGGITAIAPTVAGVARRVFGRGSRQRELVDVRSVPEPSDPHPTTETPQLSVYETTHATIQERTDHILSFVPSHNMPIPVGQSEGLAQLMMTRIHLPSGWRSEILQVCVQMGGTVIASGPSAIVLTFTGTPARLDEIETYLTAQTAVTAQRTTVLSSDNADRVRDGGATDASDTEESSQPPHLGLPTIRDGDPQSREHDGRIGHP